MVLMPIDNQSFDMTDICIAEDGTELYIDMGSVSVLGTEGGVCLLGVK